MAEPEPKYLTVNDFTDEAPTSRISELSQDTPNDYSLDEAKVKSAILWAEGVFESKIASRSDYVIKKAEVVNGSAESATVKEFIYDAAMWKLFKRREFIPDAIQIAFDMQMTWLSEVVARKADLPVFNDDGEQIDTQSHQPIVGGQRGRNDFDNWSY